MSAGLEMPLEGPYLQHALDRSHEDAKAANTLAQATGQALILVNGGAATATLTFSAAQYAPIHIGFPFLGLALICFSAGVVYGVRTLGLQGLAAQDWSFFHELRAGVYQEPPMDEKRESAHSFNEAVGRSVDRSQYLFLLGIFFIAFPLILASSPLASMTSQYPWLSWLLPSSGACDVSSSAHR